LVRISKRRNVLPSTIVQERLVVRMPRFSRIAIILSAGACAILLAAGVAAFLQRTNSPTRQDLPVNAGPATVYCVFYDFTHASVVVGFDFVVAVTDGAPLRFSQRSMAARDGTQISFDADQRPNWPYALDEDGAPQITSPDGATRIVLYGLKPEAKGEVWVGAGLRSNEYRNLDGQCRQNNLGGTLPATAAQ
jgi:hypothetical protein